MGSTTNEVGSGNKTTHQEMQDPQPQPKAERLALRYRLKDKRIAKTLALLAKGFNQAEIAQIQGVAESTISRDIDELDRRAQAEINKYAQKTLPQEHLKSLAELDEIRRELWLIYTKNKQTADPKTLAAILSTIIEARGERDRAAGNAEYIRHLCQTVVKLKAHVESIHQGAADSSTKEEQQGASEQNE